VGPNYVNGLIHSFPKTILSFVCSAAVYLIGTTSACKTADPQVTKVIICENWTNVD